MDFHQKRVKKQINDLESLVAQDQHWEVVHRKQEFRELRLKMQNYVQEYRRPR